MNELQITIKVPLGAQATISQETDDAAAPFPPPVAGWAPRRDEPVAPPPPPIDALGVPVAVAETEGPPSIGSLSTTAIVHGAGPPDVEEIGADPLQAADDLSPPDVSGLGGRRSSSTGSDAAPPKRASPKPRDGSKKR